MTAEGISQTLGTLRFRASNERELQEGIHAWLSDQFPGAFEREYALIKRDRPDFFAHSLGIIIEVKWGPTGGTLTRVIEQLMRYGEHPNVREIIFATASAKPLLHIPETVSEKPIHSVLLRTAF